jgi:hypothetical protein
MSRASTGTEVFFAIRRFTRPPSTPTPSECPDTSSSSAAPDWRASSSACTAAPSATASSGCTSVEGGLPK